MTEKPVFMIANLVISDPDAYQPYGKGFLPLLKQHGGELLAVDEASDTVEGAAPLSGRVVILKFASEAQARGWYEDPAYQALSAHRRAASQTSFITLVHGLAPRPA
jgi:uncharacterized protein (DUF1330 family)